MEAEQRAFKAEEKMVQGMSDSPNEVALPGSVFASPFLSIHMNFPDKPKSNAQPLPFHYSIT